jgi:type II secretory pathway pseudopilin PulG
MPGKIKGYTILQMMLTIALIAILASIVFIAINPAKNFADTRNEQRASDLRSLTNGLQQYTVNHQGKIFPGIDSKLRIIGTSGSGCNMSCTIVAAQGDPTANFAYSANSATAFNSGTYSNTTFNNITQMVELNTN